MSDATRLALVGRDRGKDADPLDYAVAILDADADPDGVTVGVRLADGARELLDGLTSDLIPLDGDAPRRLMPRYELLATDPDMLPYAGPFALVTLTPLGETADGSRPCSIEVSTPAWLAEDAVNGALQALQWIFEAGERQRKQTD